MAIFLDHETTEYGAIWHLAASAQSKDIGQEEQCEREMSS